MRTDFSEQGYMADHDEQLFQRDLLNFKQNPAWNFSAYLVIWAPLFICAYFSLELRKSVCVWRTRLQPAGDFNGSTSVSWDVHGRRT